MDEDTLDDVLLNAHQNPQEVEFAGFWIRFLASIVDSFALIPLVLLSFYNIFVLKSVLLMIILTILSTIYKPLLEWKYGATFGKMAVKIQVVNENLGKINAEQAIGRYIPWLITQLLSLITSFYMFNSPDFDNVTSFDDLGTFAQNLPTDNASTIYNFIFIFLVGSLAFDKRKQGIHDKIAKTLCIKKNQKNV